MSMPMTSSGRFSALKSWFAPKGTNEPVSPSSGISIYDTSLFPVEKCLAS